jgi:peptidoglycan/LPS O-acetylase OafA/YrhL
LLWVYHQDGSPLVRFPGSKPLRALGVLSYGIYMWHVISNICLATALDRWAKYSILSSSPWLRLAASLTMAIAFAAVSRWLVERAYIGPGFLDTGGC